MDSLSGLWGLREILFGEVETGYGPLLERDESLREIRREALSDSRLASLLFWRFNGIPND